jgi:hypothetical protein
VHSMECLPSGFRVTVDPKTLTNPVEVNKSHGHQRHVSRCKSPKYKQNGHMHNGKSHHQCHDGMVKLTLAAQVFLLQVGWIPHKEGNCTTQGAALGRKAK